MVIVNNTDPQFIAAACTCTWGQSVRYYLLMHDSRLSIQAMHNFGREVGGRSDAVQT